MIVLQQNMIVTMSMIVYARNEMKVDGHMLHDLIIRKTVFNVSLSPSLFQPQTDAADSSNVKTVNMKTFETVSFSR